MAKSNFRRDLEQGKEAEREVQRGLGGDLTQGRCSTHDLKIEVKWDKKSYETGNVAFEYECNGKPSGIKVTESEWWIYRIGNTELQDYVYYIRNTRGLLQWLRELHKRGRVKQVSGGDGKRAKILLVPLQDFILEFRQLHLDIFLAELVEEKIEDAY